MRILVHIRFPHEPFNAAVRSGTVGKTIDRILADTKPEAVYFTEDRRPAGSHSDRRRGGRLEGARRGRALVPAVQRRRELSRRDDPRQSRARRPRRAR